jgi:hypothetical protein
MNRPSTVASATIPSPPISTNAKMIPCPAGDQYVEVSTVASPVTVTADADVKNAGINPGAYWPERANGSKSSSVPTRINAKNVSGSRRTGWAIEAGSDSLGGRSTR